MQKARRYNPQFLLHLCIFRRLYIPTHRRLFRNIHRRASILNCGATKSFHCAQSLKFRNAQTRFRAGNRRYIRIDAHIRRRKTAQKPRFQRRLRAVCRPQPPSRRAKCAKYRATPPFSAFPQDFPLSGAELRT